MCGICTNPSNLPIKNYDKSKYKELHNIVHEYTGDYACKKCIGVYNKLQSTKSIDEYIISKLTTLALRKFTARERKAAQARVYRRYNAVKYKNKNVNHTIVEPNITCTKNNNTGTTFYIARIILNRNINRKTFKTLKEAQQYKQEVLNNEYKTA